MSLTDQMLSVSRLLRHPAELPTVLTTASKDDAAILETIDAIRLEAVSKTHALLVSSRWWQARFPAVLATLAHMLGDRLVAARHLMANDAFEAAIEEDVTAAAIVTATLELAAGDAPEWLPELLTYEYLISTGLPRRGRGESICAATEERLLTNASFFEGGRLSTTVLACHFEWPVGSLQEEPYDAQPDPHTLLFFLQGAEAIEIDAGHHGADAIELLAGGATDEVLREALGEEADAMLALLAELELLT